MGATAWSSDATTQSAALTSDWLLFTFAGVAMAIIVGGLIVFAMLRWRRRENAPLPRQFRNNVPLEIGWTIVPLLIVLGLFYYSYRAEATVEAIAPHPDVTVSVNAYRWGWTFTYAGGPTVGGAAGAPVLGGTEGPPQLVLPVGMTTRIELTASDVTHGFWIPAFFFKRDAIPGQMTAFDLRPNKLGSFAGRCAQFCGLEHALMAFDVRVVSAQTFARWRRQPLPL